MAAALVMSIIPAHIMRSVAGGTCVCVLSVYCVCIVCVFCVLCVFCVRVLWVGACVRARSYMLLEVFVSMDTNTHKCRCFTYIYMTICVRQSRMSHGIKLDEIRVDNAY